MAFSKKPSWTLPDSPRATVFRYFSELSFRDSDCHQLAEKMTHYNWGEHMLKGRSLSTNLDQGPNNPRVFHRVGGREVGYLMFVRRDLLAGHIHQITVLSKNCWNFARKPSRKKPIVPLILPLFVRRHLCGGWKATPNFAREIPKAQENFGGDESMQHKVLCAHQIK